MNLSHQDPLAHTELTFFVHAKLENNNASDKVNKQATQDNNHKDPA